jgi:hypothetical protein
MHNPCDYHKFVPGTWDAFIWEDIRACLRNDAWVEAQLKSVGTQDENAGKLVRLEQFKVSRMKVKMAKVQEDVLEEIFTKDEAISRIAEYRSAIARAEAEITRLQQAAEARSLSILDAEAMRRELRLLRDRNLADASFQEKLDIVSKLGVRVYPAEDLRSARVPCRLNIGLGHPAEEQAQAGSTHDGCELQSGCGKVKTGSPDLCPKAFFGSPSLLN